MRITNNVIYNTLLKDINQNRSDMFDIQQSTASGKRVEKPSDNPFNYANSKGLEEVNRQLNQYQNNIDSGLHQAREAQYSLDQMLDQFYEAKKLATNAANESVHAQEELDIMADQVANIRDILVDQANTQVNGRYLFAGTATQTQPFSISGSSVNYNGNSSDIKVKVNDQTSVPISVTGDTFNSAFQSLTDLENAMRAGDTDAVRNTIDDIDDSINTIADSGTNVGSTINRLEYLFEQFEGSKNNNSKEISRLVDTDYAEALSQLQKYQVSYRAALNANSRLINTSLVNYL